MELPTSPDLEVFFSLILKEFMIKYRDLVLHKETLLDSFPYGN